MMDVLIDNAFAPAHRAVEEGRIPGAALGIITRDGVRAKRFFGAAQMVPTHDPLHGDTWFDLASLTKVMVTTPAILDQVQAGRIALDDPLSSVIPDLRQYDASAAERALTFRQLLGHNTPLPAVEPLYTLGLDPATLRAHILQRDWPKGPAVYSDINFLLLGIALERLEQRPFSDRSLPPGLGFTPDPAHTAATEFCHWRGRMLRGEVHDENASAMGGAAGHAGLFGTVDGVLNYAQSILDGSRLDAPLVAGMMTRQHANRTLGWEMKHDNWSGGQNCSAHTIGHTGFTGTGLWLDPERGLGWTLLTNRVHPSRHVDTGIMALRRATGELICA